MGGITGPTVSSCPHPTQTNKSRDNVATVKTGETTLRQVAQRLGVSEEALRNANPQIKDPNKLQAGQDLCLPEKSQVKEASSPSNTSKSKDHKTKDGLKGTTYRKRNWEYSAKPTGSTSPIADSEGNTDARRAQRTREEETSPRDEKDLPPAQIKKEKQREIENAGKYADPVVDDVRKKMSGEKGGRPVHPNDRRKVDPALRESERACRISLQSKCPNTSANPPVQNNSQK